MATRRLPGEGSIYQRESDGRWVGVVDLGWVAGKRVRKTVSAKTLKEVRVKFKALNAQLEGGVDPDHMTVEQWMNWWLEKVVEKSNRPSTALTYRRYVDKWVIPHLGKRRLDRLRAEHIEALYDAMEEQGLSNGTRRQVHAILHRSLKVAMRRKKIVSNPAEYVEPPPVSTGSHGKFDLDEAKLILRSIGDDPLRSRWVVALLAGIRQGEALGLRWENVDFDRRVIVIEQAGQQIKGQGMQVVPLKSKAAYRAVPMVDPVYELLWQERKPSGFVWGGDQMMRSRDDWGAWKAMLERVGVPHRALHAARATTGSLLLDADVPDKIIAEILGHSQVMVTQKHYLHGDDTMRAAAMKRMGDLILDA